jgi:nitrate reductase NapE component
MHIGSSSATQRQVPFISLAPFLLITFWPYDTVGFVAAAFLIVWLNRTAMFRRAGAAINVIP